MVSEAALRPEYDAVSAPAALPNGWQSRPLGDLIVSFQLGGNYPNSERDSGWPLIKMGNIGRGDVDVAKLEFISTAPSAADRLRCGDVLFNTRNTLALVGKVAIWRGELPEAYFNSNIARLTFNDELVASNAFMNYALNSEATITSLRGIAIGTTSVAAIYTRDLFKVAIAVPNSRVEQIAIADALSSADSSIMALESLITKKHALMQGVMQELLTGQRRLPAFNGKWNFKSLGACGSWKGGMTPSMRDARYWENGSVPWVSSGDVKTPTLADTASHVTNFAISEGKTTLVPAKAVLIVMRSGILRRYLPVALTDVSMAINQDIKAIITAAGVIPEFLCFSMRLHGPRILAACMKLGTTVESLELRWLKAFEIPMPDKEEQRAIADVLGKMDVEIDVLNQELAKARDIKKGMMQDLLTGRVRLV